MATLLAMRLLGMTVVGGAVGGVSQYQRDEGFRRSVQFWTQAMPAYLHYRAVEMMMQGSSEEKQAEAYRRLHRIYSPRMERLVYHLRGFYLKLVQVGSTRDEFLPPEYMSWAKKTQDSVPVELSPAQIRTVVEDSLGCKIGDLFRSFDDAPLGAASIGQVHRAELLDGRQVAVKVQYPRIEERFRADIATSKQFAKLAQPQYLPLMEEVERQFQTEFDYRGEAENLQRIREEVLPIYGDRIAIPEPILDLCCRNVLVMEFLPGTRLVDGIREQYRQLAARSGRSLEEIEREQREQAEGHRGDDGVGDGHRRRSLWRATLLVHLLNAYFFVADHVLNAAKWLLNHSVGVLSHGRYRWDYRDRVQLINLAKILQLLVEVHGYEILVAGCFNADPHPGNVLLCPDGRLGLLDYGQVKTWSPSSRRIYAELIDAIHRDDRDRIVEVFGTKMGFRSEKMDPDCLYRRACFFHDRDTDDITHGLNIQLFMEELNRIDPVISQSGEFILAGRVSFLMRGMGNAFNLMLRISDHWYPFADRILREEAAPR